MDKKKGTVPLGVLLITINYAFGAIMLLAFLFISPTQISSMIAERHGLPTFTGPWILPAVACLSLMIAYGLYSLSKWGFVLTIGYLLYFGWINCVLYVAQASWTYLGSIIWPCLVIFYLILIRKCYFFKEVKAQFTDRMKPTDNVLQLK